MSKNIFLNVSTDSRERYHDTASMHEIRVNGAIQTAENKHSGKTLMVVKMEQVVTHPIPTAEVYNTAIIMEVS